MQTSQDISSGEPSPFKIHGVQNNGEPSRGLFGKFCRLLFAIVLAIAAVPLMLVAVEWRLVDDAFWVVIPLFVLTSIIAVIRSRREPLTGTQGRSIFVLGLFCAAMPLLAFAYLILSAWLTLVVMLLLGAALAIRLSSTTKSTDYLSVLALMSLLVWVPFGIGLGIQRVVTDGVLSIVFPVFDIQGWVYRFEGGHLAFLDSRLDLKPIMEGYISLSSIFYLIGFLLFIRRRPMIHSVMMMVFGAVVVWGVLALRVLAVSFLAMRFNLIEWTGFLRWILELGSFLVVALLAYGLDQTFAVILARIRLDGNYARLRSPKSRKFVKFWNWLTTFEVLRLVRQLITKKSPRPKRRWIMLSGAALRWCFLLPVFCLSLLWVNTRLGDAGISKLRGAGMVPEEQLVVLGEGAYKPTISNWVVDSVTNSRRESDSLWGEFSETWVLKKEGITISLSIDYAFDDWHDVKECYMLRGWQLRSEQIVPSLMNPEWDVSQTRMIDEDGKASVVFCSHSNFLGDPLQSGPVKLLNKLKYRLTPENWGSPFDIMLTSEEKTRYQYQLICSSSGIIDEAERKELQMVYEDFREQIRKILQTRAGR